MEKKVFERVDETIYIEKLDNGISVYLYPTENTKNFYMSISVKYGAMVNKYRLGNKIYDVIPGSAHFLEHKVMALSENKKISKKINELGSLANAWTSYRGTNYNIFGSNNLKENLLILLDLFYHPNITDDSVEKEKGIICEEIDMYKDQIDRYMFDVLSDNLFHDSYMNNTVVGERSDIEKITSKNLMKIYNDFYVPNNTFIIVCGNFDKDEIIDFIKNYISKLNIRKKELPKIITKKDKPSVKVNYQELKRNMEESRVKIGIKIDKKIFGIKDDEILKKYLMSILSINFSASGKLYEKYKNEDIIISMSAASNIFDDYLIIYINAFTHDGDLFIKNIKKDICNLKLCKSDFERKKKLYLKYYITEFDNIEDIEYLISENIFLENKINYKEFSDIENMEYYEALRIIKLINCDNISILKTTK